MSARDPDPDVRDRYAGTPRWVKVFGLVAVLVVLVIAVMLITGLGGQHGPQRHGGRLDGSAPLGSAVAGEFR